MIVIAKARRSPPQRLFVEEPSDNPLWQLLHRVGDKYYPALRDLMRNTWDRWRNALDMRRLFDGILGNNTAMVVADVERGWMTAENEMLAAARPILADAVEEAFNETTPIINGQISGVFSPGSGRQVQDWITRHTGEWITQIGATERQAIREVILDGMQQGRAPAVVAREIRQYIGVTSPQAKTIMRRRAAMEAAGIPAKRIEAVIEKLTAKKIRERAMVIARNEAMVATKEGNRMAYQEAVEDGAINGDTARRHWVITPLDACPTCLPIPGMNPEGRRLDEPYATPIGQLMTAHAHIQCRCVEVIKI